MIDQKILAKLKRLKIITKRVVKESLTGDYHSIFKGKGLEFYDVRRYERGDDVRSIDWHVTARTGYPHIKINIEERELTNIILFDASASSLFGKQDMTKRELAANVSAVLSFASIMNNDKVGLFIFTDTVEKRIPPARGEKHIMRLIRDLLLFKPKGKKTNLNLAIKEVSRVIKRHSIIFLISDFHEELDRSLLKMFENRFDIVPVLVVDPWEKNLPDIGEITFTDTETNEEITIDSSSKKIRDEYKSRWEKFYEDRKSYFKKLGMDYIEIENGKSYIDPVVSYFQKRKKRIRR